MRTYAAYGLNIASQVEIPGAIPGHPSDAAADVTIVEGVFDRRDHGSRLGPYCLAGDRLWFEVPRIAAYSCEGGARITVQPLLGGDDGDRAAHLVASALPALLWQRGDVVLHAAAARLPGAEAAVAIGGPSGSGKSAVLDRLVAAGGGVLGDDTLRIGPGPEGVIVNGLPAAYFLAPDVGTPLKARPLHPVPTARQIASCRLDHFFRLAPRGDDASARFRPMAPFDACEVLLRSRHRPLVPRLLGRERAILPILACLVQCLRVWEWSRPHGVVDLSERELAFLAEPGGAET